MGSIPGLTQWDKDPVFPCAVVWVADAARIWRCRELWCRPAAVAPIRPLAWELPYAMGAALKRQKKIYSIQHNGEKGHQPAYETFCTLDEVFIFHEKNDILEFPLWRSG